MRKLKLLLILVLFVVEGLLLTNSIAIAAVSGVLEGPDTVMMNSTFDISVSISGTGKTAAIDLRIPFDTDKVRVIAFASPIGGIVTTDPDTANSSGNFTIGWLDFTGGSNTIDASAKPLLGKITFSAVGKGTTNFTFAPKPDSSIVDVNGIDITDDLSSSATVDIITLAYQFSEVAGVIKGLITNYDHWRSGLPLGDINRDRIGNAPTTERLIFSESVSYCLFSHVLPILGEDETSAENNFLECWNWAKTNMVRKNISKVFRWETQTWEDMPQHLKDNLLAWRYVININNTGQNGVIYAEQDDDSGKWHDGTQVATDGDLLTAYSLHLAYKRGWGDELLTDARAIAQDIRKKAAVNFTAGELYNAQTAKTPSNMFYGKFDDNGDIGSFTELTDISDAFGWEGRHNYMGVYHEPFLNFGNLEKIEVVLKGNIGANAKLDLRLQDTSAVSGDINQPGHVYMSLPIELTDDFKTITVNKGDFKKNPDYGTQEGELDWSGVRNVQFQAGKYEMHDRYSGSYNDGTQGTITMLNAPGLIAWQGHRNYVGFTYREILNLTDLKSVSIILKGSGKVELRLEDDIKVSPDDSGHIYTTPSIDLTDNFQTFIFSKSDFTKFLYAGNQSGTLNWDKIKKVQVQVNETSSTVYLQSIVIELNNGKKCVINDGTVESSKVYVKSVKAFLSAGQTSQNNGYKLFSNAHGALHINPSYFMPFAYRVFAEIDSEGENVWNSLIDATYSELNAALGLTLNDLSNVSVKGNGKLVPNWYMFDKLTGERVDISTQKPDGNVRGYEFGYDAFRTIWYAAFDYSMFKDLRAKDFLQTVLTFFQEELKSKDYFYPEYRIEGIPSEQYESGAGFPSVYLNLFNLCGDRGNEHKVINRLWQHKKTSDERAWFSNPQNPSEGEDEYFMNFWAFFGLYLYQRNNLGDMDNNQTVDLRDAISGLKILTDINIPGISVSDINGDNKIGFEEIFYILQIISGIK